MPPRKNSLLDAAALIAAGGAPAPSVGAPPTKPTATRTRSKTPTKKKTSTAAVTITAAVDDMNATHNNHTMMLSSGSNANSRSVSATFDDAPAAVMSRASSVASIPSGQYITPAISAPPTPSGNHHQHSSLMHMAASGSNSNLFGSATAPNAPAVGVNTPTMPSSTTSSRRGSVAAGHHKEQQELLKQQAIRAMHETINTMDDYADLSVLTAAEAAKYVSGNVTVRRVLPTSSAFAPPAVITNALRQAASTGVSIAGLRNPAYDLGTGHPQDPIKTPHYPNGGTNETGCCHCTHTTHCDCEYVADVLFDVFENQLTQKRIIERSTSSSAAGGGGGSRSRSQTADAAAASRSNSTTATSSHNTSVLSDNDERSNSMTFDGFASNPAYTPSYNAAPAALSSMAVTSKTMTGSSTRHLCAKSLLPPFVARLIRLMDVKPGDSFYDLGCGNGSILFQVALSAGATCVGVELCPHNAQLARDAWGLIKPIFENKLQSTYGAPSTGRMATRAATAAAANAPNLGLPQVEIITGDIANLITDEAFLSRPRKILLSNLLFPKELSQFIGDWCRKLPQGSMVVCFDDLYPHSRSVSRIRDPQAFELFEMTDYEWPKGSVEWCYQEGKFYIHTRK